MGLLLRGRGHVDSLLLGVQEERGLGGHFDHGRGVLEKGGAFLQVLASGDSALVGGHLHRRLVARCFVGLVVAFVDARLRLVAAARISTAGLHSAAPALIQLKTLGVGLGVLFGVGGFVEGYADGILLLLCLRLALLARVEELLVRVV
jgi:hypothetical protein